MKFNSRLREIRKQQGKTQRMLANATGISERNYQTYENGKYKPSYQNLVLIAEYLEVSLDYLVGRTDKNRTITQSATNTKLHERLQYLRDVNKRTQDQVSIGVNITHANYQKMECGKGKPSFQTLIALADYFNVSIDYLVGRTDDPEIHRKS